MNNITLTDMCKTCVTYEGHVTIEYFDKVRGRKKVYAHNEGKYPLFNSIVKMLRGDSDMTIPGYVEVGYKPSGGSTTVTWTAPIFRKVTPLLSKIEGVGDNLKEIGENASAGNCNCITYTFVIPRGTIESGSITDLRLCTADGSGTTGDKAFAQVTLDNPTEVDSKSNMQIHWKLIFKN